MTKSLTPDRTHLAAVSGLIAERMGLHFPEERWPDLARAIQAAGAELSGFDDHESFARWRTTRELTNRQIETLASHLTVGETYFFRDPASFDVLEQEILPAIMAKRAEAGRTLRLWSAACCTGEEAYSLAMSCTRVIPKLSEWNVSILATDINPRFLAKADAGIYSDWSFRGIRAGLRERFFTPLPGKKLAIDPTLKKLVQFGYLNLAEDAYPSLHNRTNAMDVIFCRNVLMYFTPEHQRRVVAALYRCLVDGGCLLVNPAEASHALFPMFAMENIGGVIVFRKTSQAIGDRARSAWVSPATPPVVLTPEPAVLVVPAAPQPVVPDASARPVTPTTALPRDEPLALARIHANQGRLEEALASCQAAIAADRTRVAAHFLCATICQELGRPEAAIAALNRVLYLDQDFVLAHQALGLLYKRLGKHDKARRHLGIALELLSAKGRDEIVPESDGMTCGRLLESVRSMTEAK